MATSDKNAPGENAEPKVTKEIAAEAAVWIARLHGPSRSPQMERDFRAWQARSAAHRRAFEATTDMWEAVPRINLSDVYAGMSARSSWSRRGWAGGGDRWRLKGQRWPLLVALPLIVLAVAGYLRFSAGGDLYATKIGDQHRITLDDGSRMTLNTDTRVRVKFGADKRDVDVLQGEALFEVAKDARRPFIVHAGASEVVAVGTVFSVRLAAGGDHLADALAVTLVEGKVVVRPDPSAWTAGLAPAEPVQMNAGDRVRLAGTSATQGGPPKEQLDRPRIDQLLAWKRNEAEFDDVSLADAAAEMNRYSRTPIVLMGDAALSQLRISGRFHTGDSAGFARNVCAVHGLMLQERDGRFELTLPH